MSEPNPSRARPLLQALAFATVYLVWGSTYLAIRVGVETIRPLVMGACRFLLAGGVLYAVLRARGVAAPSAAEWRHAALAGVLMLSFGNGLVSWAEQTVASNLTALLVAAVPLYIALIDWLRPGGLRPRRQVLGGIAVGFGGMILLAAPERGLAGGAGAPSGAGVVAVLLAGLAWAAGMLYARYGARHPHPLMAAAAQMITGGAALALAALVHGDLARGTLAAVSRESALAFAYLVVFGSLVAFSAYAWLVVVSTPARVSTTAYVNPAIAVVLGWLLLDEALAPRALAGAGLIVAAVMVMTLGPGPLGMARARRAARR